MTLDDLITILKTGGGSNVILLLAIWVAIRASDMAKTAVASLKSIDENLQKSHTEIKASLVKIDDDIGEVKEAVTALPLQIIRARP